MAWKWGDGWRLGKAAAAAVAILGSADSSGAGQVRVMTDRPDRANSTDTIPPGMLQIEGGLTFLRDASGDRPVRRLKTEGSLRLGIAETVEVDIVTDGFVRERGEGEGTSGLADMTLAAKWRLLETQGWRPSVGLVPFVKLPTASRSKGLGTGRMDFGALLAVGQDLPADLHVDVNLGLAGLSLAEAPGGLFLQKTAAASFSWLATDRLTPYWEIFYESRDRPAGRHGVGTDFGVVATLTDRIAVDASAEFRLAGASPDWAVRAGLTLLLGSFAEGGSSAAARGAPRAAGFDTSVERAYYAGMAWTPAKGVQP